MNTSKVYPNFRGVHTCVDVTTVLCGLCLVFDQSSKTTEVYPLTGIGADGATIAQHLVGAHGWRSAIGTAALRKAGLSYEIDVVRDYSARRDAMLTACDAILGAAQDSEFVEKVAKMKGVPVEAVGKVADAFYDLLADPDMSEEEAACWGKIRAYWEEAVLRCNPYSHDADAIRDRRAEAGEDTPSYASSLDPNSLVGP